MNQLTADLMQCTVGADGVTCLSEESKFYCSLGTLLQGRIKDLVKGATTFFCLFLLMKHIGFSPTTLGTRVRLRALEALGFFISLLNMHFPLFIFFVKQ